MHSGRDCIPVARINLHSQNPRAAFLLMLHAQSAACYHHLHVIHVTTLLRCLHSAVAGFACIPYVTAFLVLRIVLHSLLSAFLCVCILFDMHSGGLDCRAYASAGGCCRRHATDTYIS